MVTASGVIINPTYCFLGASLDGAVYDPFNSMLKCPYSARNLTPTEACGVNGFYCRLNSVRQLELKENHYAQVQGQMAIGERPWCDFVVFTLKGISIQRIPYNQSYWTSKLLPFHFMTTVLLLNL